MKLQKCKLIFATKGILSVQQIANILNLIKPFSVEDHQQANERLIIYCSFYNEITADEINDLIPSLGYAECISVSEIDVHTAYEYILKLGGIK